jgi:hypothetical protein
VPDVRAVTVSGIKDKLAKAKLPERTVTLCLNGDLVAEHEKLERELTQAQKRPNDSLAGNGVAELAERIEALEVEMREATETFTFRALPKRRSQADDRPTWDEVMKRNPPRRGEDGEIIAEDREGQLNADAFGDDLIRTCAVSPEMDAEDWDALFSVISDRQYVDLSNAAWLINRGEISVPFSRAASRMRAASATE